MQNPDFWLLKLTLLLTSTLTIMAGATIAPSLPAMQNHFADVENAEFWVRLLLTTPALLIALGAPLVGQLVDTLGRKPLLIASALLYGVAGSSGFFLDSLLQMLIGRAFLGLAVAGIMVSATTLIADYYQGDRRSSFMGLQAAFMSLGGVVFLSVGGFIADINWRFPFLIYLFSWLLLPGIIWVLYEPVSAPTQNPSITSPSDVDQTEVKTPFKLLGLIYGSALILQIVFYMIPVQLPFYLGQLSGASASQSGLAIALVTLFAAIASMNYGKIKQKFSYIQVLAISFVLIGLGYIGVGLVGSYNLVLLVLIPAGFGLGMLTPNLNVWTTITVSTALRGRALGGLTTCLFLGQFLSPIVTQPLNQAIKLAGTYGLAGVLMIVLGTIFWIYQQKITKFSESI
ncbi:MFS transporter [Nodularia harveyana UHCC-0300]|uniref:MFS transporter n=1 Tax=Nodularia harveyana UHCC-0300 TaxID=2974287 RepID=A0ABU5UIV6_9CYAN|nr:MFS transporter [Nodularia harveyana]MEA5583134.1 MFS transporter [Nodularia harveyana UHCC-0300]